MGFATYTLFALGLGRSPIGWALLAFNTVLGALGGAKLMEMLGSAFRGTLKGPSIGGVAGGLVLGAAYSLPALVMSAYGMPAALMVGVGAFATLGGAKLGSLAEGAIRDALGR
jgi:hypothetical protein